MKQSSFELGLATMMLIAGAPGCVINGNDDAEDTGSSDSGSHGTDSDGVTTAITTATAGTAGTESEGNTEATTATSGTGPGTAGESGATTTGETGPGREIACADDNGSLSLPEGFCATVFADDLGHARHMAVTPSGDVFVAIANGGKDDSVGHVVSLRDEDGDGIADKRESFGTNGANGIAWRDNTLFVAENERIVRFAVADGELVPTGESEVVVGGMPHTGDHIAKTVVFAPNGDLFVNFGSASNACQEANRVEESPGLDPCPEVEFRAGIWLFDSETIGQTPAEGVRFAQGVRNANALAVNPVDGVLWGAQNGRDQLFDNWPELYTEEDEQELPAEEIFRLEDGGDYGWPYCYYDPHLDAKVLAPEYGGDGSTVGRCEYVMGPEATLPAHWAPLGIHFYAGSLFPEAYRGGMFVASHGSRFAPMAEDPPGYSVEYIPFADGSPAGEAVTFADDFAGDERPLPDAAEHRPVGLAEAPDGSLYISDDHGGRIWRVYYGVN